MRAPDGWFALSSLANCAWIFSWHYGLYPLSLLLMVILLVCLIAIHSRLHSARISGRSPSVSTRLLVRLPFSIYLGWISVATIANASDVLSWAGFGGFGVPETTWTIALAIVASLLALAMSLRRRDIGFSAVIAWALYGIIQKQAGFPAIVTGCWVAIGIVGLGLVLAFILPPVRTKAR